VRLRAGTPDQLILSAALCCLQGAERWPFSMAGLNTMPAEEQDACFRSWVARDVLPLIAHAATLAGVELPEKLRDGFAANCKAAKSLLSVQRTELGLLAAKMRAVSAPLMLFRSLDLADNVWPQLPLNSSAARILVHPPQTTEAKTCLAQTGFVQGQLDREKGRVIPATLKELQDQEIRGGKLAAFRKMIRLSELDEFASFLRAENQRPEFLVVGSQVYGVCEIQVHLTVLGGVDIPDTWAKSRSIRLGDESVLGQDPSDMLWTLATCCYHEIMLDVTRPIRAFLDVLAALSKFAAELNWEHIKKVANQYGLEPALYYVLRHAQELLGEQIIPTAQLELFYPLRSEVVRRRDWGDFAPRLFNAEVPYTPFRIEGSDGAELGPATQLNGSADSQESESHRHIPTVSPMRPAAE
jgi:hypothetical protein